MINSRELNIALAVGGITTALIGIISYVNNRGHRKMQNEIMALDKEIKSLQLNKVKKEMSDE